MPEATSLHHCLMNKQLKLNAFSSKDPAIGLFSIMHSSFETLGKYLLLAMYLTSTNISTAQQKNRIHIGPTEILVSLSVCFSGNFS